MLTAALKVPISRPPGERQPLLNNKEDLHSGSSSATLHTLCAERKSSFLSTITYSWFTKTVFFGFRHSLVHEDLLKTLLPPGLNTISGVQLDQKGSDFESFSSTSSWQTGNRKLRRKFKKQKGTELWEGGKSLELATKLVEDEDVQIGNVKFAVFVGFIKACGFVTMGWSMILYALIIGAQAGANIWLSQWSSDQPVNGTQNLELRNLRLGVYGGLGAVQVAAVLGYSLVISVGCVLASRVLHGELLASILRAPMSFFETTPLGRILNRFSRDVDILNFNIPMTLKMWLYKFSTVITTIIVITYTTPIFLTVALPLVLITFLIQRLYMATNRQLKRIDSVQRSPIYTHFSETLNGLSSIRAYRKQDEFINYLDDLVDTNQMVYFPSIICNRWASIWLELLSSLVVLCSAVFAILERDTITPALAGLSVSYALQMTSVVNGLVQMTSEMETYTVSIERIKEYTECPQEAPDIIEANTPKDSWPESGLVQFCDYATRYRPGLDLVLRNINCSIHDGESVGIVGRTGAGKSSPTLALFRIIEAATGKVVIDGYDVSNIGLSDLRSRLTIIPQDPVLFCGTLRMNLDPFEKYTDDEIWTALEHAHLKSFVLEQPSRLLHECTEGGENLSIGQRQLVCLARALLRNSKILVLDEATAAVDLETDDLIQKTIRTEFSASTVITIAHRLNTIMDYDRVMVLDNGAIVQFDTPSNLQQDTSGIFYNMAKDAGLL